MTVITRSNKSHNDLVRENTTAINTFYNNLMHYSELIRDKDIVIDYVYYLETIHNAIDYSLDDVKKSTLFYKKMKKVKTMYENTLYIIGKDCDEIVTDREYTLRKAVIKAIEIYQNILSETATELKFDF